jgi:hypothetical protein
MWDMKELCVLNGMFMDASIWLGVDSLWWMMKHTLEDQSLISNACIVRFFPFSWQAT